MPKPKTSAFRKRRPPRCGREPSPVSNPAACANPSSTMRPERGGFFGSHLPGLGCCHANSPGATEPPREMPMIKLSAAPVALAGAPPLVPGEPAIDLPAIDLPAIDLAHLARMTLGDRSLEREVLELFGRQAEIL